MSYRFIATRRDGPVEHLLLNRPEVRNAFNEEVIAELLSWAEGLHQDRSARVAVVSGAGPSFCAGADVSWMAKTVAYSREENLRDALAASRMFAAIDGLPLLVIGRVHGAALGGGAGLAAVCDVVVAAEGTTFGFTETRLGILPAVISPFVVAKIGRSAARQLFLTGTTFSAARAKEIGLVHTVVPEHELEETVAGVVREGLKAGPEAVAAAKALIAGISGRPLDQVMPVAAEAIAARRVSAEGQEGLRAFLEKRRPRWSNGEPT